jgi:glycosyltransferase involved in cell wall biosynthesis
MRIVQALGWYFPESLGGTEVYVAGLCRRLRAAGRDVRVAAPEAGAPGERIYEHDGIPVYRYPVPSRPTRDESQGVAPARGAERFHAWLARERPDVVHVHSFVTGLGLDEIRAAKSAGARVVVTAHTPGLGWLCQRGSMMRFGEAPCDGIARPGKCAACELQHRGLPKAAARLLSAVPPPAARLARSLPGPVGTALGMPDLIARNQARQREMLAEVDRFVVLTGWAMGALEANGFTQSHLALNRLGMSQDKATAKPGPAERPTPTPVTVGYLGRFDALKGVHDLARAVASLPRSVAVRVELRGPATGAAERQVRNEVESLLRDDGRVVFAPAVTSAGTLDVLAGYDVLCCPSVCAEGGPTAAIEAHAVGTPVIGTRIGGLAELVTDGVNGRLVPPGDWRALASALADLARDPAGTVDRWRLALPRARTMDEIAADYEALYAEALSRR